MSFCRDVSAAERVYGLESLRWPSVSESLSATRCKKLLTPSPKTIRIASPCSHVRALQRYYRIEQFGDQGSDRGRLRILKKFHVR